MPKLDISFLKQKKKNISYEIFLCRTNSNAFGLVFFFSFFCICFVSNEKNFFLYKKKKVLYPTCFSAAVSIVNVASLESTRILKLY